MLREDEFRTNTNIIVTRFLASCEGPRRPDFGSRRVDVAPPHPSISPRLKVT
jgi:hypothetical protein